MTLTEVLEGKEQRIMALEQIARVPSESIGAVSVDTRRFSCDLQGSSLHWPLYLLLGFCPEVIWSSSGLKRGLSRMFPLYVFLCKMWSYSCILGDRVLKPLAQGGGQEELQQTVCQGPHITLHVYWFEASFKIYVKYACLVSDLNLNYQ